MSDRWSSGLFCLVTQGVALGYRMSRRWRWSGAVCQARTDLFRHRSPVTRHRPLRFGRGNPRPYTFYPITIHHSRITNHHSPITRHASRFILQPSSLKSPRALGWVLRPQCGIGNRLGYPPPLVRRHVFLDTVGKGAFREEGRGTRRKRQK